MITMKHFTILLTITFLLNGCAQKDPVENIVDSHIDHMTDVLDYSYNNFEQTLEVKFLENELEACIIVLDGVKQAHYSKMEACESDIDFWKVTSLFLGLAILVGVFAKLKGLFK